MLPPKLFSEIILHVMKQGLNCGLFPKEESEELPAVENAGSI
jgi:hypothetical protein